LEGFGKPFYDRNDEGKLLSQDGLHLERAVSRGDCGEAGLRPADSRGRVSPHRRLYQWGGAYNRGVSLEAGKSERLGRVLGLDVGSRRIGIAVSDPLGITAQGLETLQRRNKREDLAALERVIREYGVREIVVGLPLRMSGAEGTQSEKMQGFAEDLRKRFRLPVHLWDERLTSAEANRLLRETELSIDKRAKAVDRMAAVLILQGWMEGRVAR
jgi:putative Holliday junction resolvase